MAAYIVSIEIPNGEELDAALDALLNSDLGGLALETLKIAIR